MKCDRCGLQSDVEQAFSAEKRFLRKSKHFCPDCTIKREARSFLWSIALVAGSGLLVFALNPSSWMVVIASEATLVLLLMIPMVIIHELAHALVAKLVGSRVFGITIGIGKTVWSGKFLGMDWIFNILPIAGITIAGGQPASHMRLKLFLTYLAGPASHVLMVLILFLLKMTLPLSTLGQRLSSSLIFANILLAVVSLFPQKTNTVVGPQGTDGWHLFRVPFLKESELTKHHIGYFAAEAMQAYAAKDLDMAKKWAGKALSLDGNSGIARNILGIIQMARGEYHSARETFLQLLESENAREPGLHYILLNNIAYMDALLHDPSLLPEADQLSAEAFKHLPWIPAILGTRGTVLIELGQLEEGIALLKKSMSLSADKQNKALNACHIAIGELRRGDPDAACRYLATAKALDSSCFLVPNVESQMARHDTGVSTPNIPIATIDHRPSTII
jgi:tetratricopeptide (TPR) repeat protein